ncbi:MAG: hypothetical protein EKK40_14260 [Bradyrhizobiaceae bacterium]|nr:MAG: hypothetical protein EKK40_14260 [Bradyrhizobiaceae bacterium]
MLFHPNRTEQLARIAGRLDAATAPTAPILGAVLQSAERAKIAGQGRPASHIERLIACGAWTDAALGLLEICIPRWQIARLIYDGGEWNCKLSPRCEWPEWLDQVIETHHTDLAIAILRAVVEAIRQEDEEQAVTGSAVRPPVDGEILISCDNFG